MSNELFPRARFLGGTLVLEDVDERVAPPAAFRWHEARWRCPAVHYRAVRPWLQAQGIRDNVPRWQRLTSLHLHDGREPHDYQVEALAAWTAADRWGSIVLPTGAGKTFVALQAIAEAAASTLVVVPTIDLLHQWYARLEAGFQTSIGVWYGLEKNAQPITVTTYPSAWSHAEALGDQFKLLVFDEIHHLPAPSWHEIALMCAAPWRLGLTATYPQAGVDGEAGADPAALLDELVGPVVYRKHVNDLTGEQLAE
ncbi:MAG: DEAD/DEAH box helicase family protein, partial [Chloroflexi bacterium]|nr:DEAD/DEAH box helicase family protein [Chloroflexota bacterium]